MTLSNMQLYFVPPSYGRSGAHGWNSTGWEIANEIWKASPILLFLAHLVSVPILPNTLNLDVVIRNKYLSMDTFFTI